MHSTPLFCSSFLNENYQAFTQWLQRLGYAKSSVQHHRYRLKNWFLFIEKQGVRQLTQVDNLLINSYLQYLDRQALQSSSLRGYYSTLRLFDQFWQQYGHAPLLQMTLPMVRHLPQAPTILSQAEVQQLYAACDHSVQGLFNRALLSIYYGCGLRAAEGLQLQTRHLDFKNGLLQVQQGKHYRQRYVPMSVAVQQDLQTWLKYGRHLVLKGSSEAVLVHGKGAYKAATGFNERLKKLVEKAGIDKPITLHGLRHSIASHLLENGMPLEQIRQFLGHQSLEITQLYTHFNSEQ